MAICYIQQQQETNAVVECIVDFFPFYPNKIPTLCHLGTSYDAFVSGHPSPIILRGHPFQAGTWIGLGIGPGAWWNSHSELLKSFQGKAINNLWVWLNIRQVCLCGLDMTFLSVNSGSWPVLRRESHSLGLGSWSPIHSCTCGHKQMIEKPRGGDSFSAEISLQNATNSWSHLIKGDRYPG